MKLFNRIVAFFCILAALVATLLAAVPWMAGSLLVLVAELFFMVVASSTAWIVKWRGSKVKPLDFDGVMVRFKID